MYTHIYVYMCIYIYITYIHIYIYIYIYLAIPCRPGGGHARMRSLQIVICTRNSSGWLETRLAKIILNYVNIA